MILSIRNKAHYFFTILLFNVCIHNSYAQVKDAEVWENISFSKKLSRDYTFHFNHEGRIVYNATIFDYAYGDFGITRSLSKHFKIAADYVIVWKQTDIRESWRHQGYTALFYKLKLAKRVEFNLRSMYQIQYQDIYSSELGRYPSNYLRNKLTISYNFDKYPFYRFTPYIATESYYHLDDNDKYGSQFDRMRYFAGVFYNFNKRSSLELYYLMENNFNSNDPTINYVSGIGYEYDF